MEDDDLGFVCERERKAREEKAKAKAAKPSFHDQEDDHYYHYYEAYEEPINELQFETKKAEAKDYMEKHEIMELLRNLTAHLVFYRPCKQASFGNVLVGFNKFVAFLKF